MHRDEIIEEVWRNRDAYVREHHHDLDEIVADLQRREKAHSANIVDRRKQRAKEPSR
jgi:hypothetical protein